MLPEWALPADLDAVKAHLERVIGAMSTEDADDSLLERLVAAATQAAEEYTGRQFVTRPRTEEHVGDGRSVLLLHRSPVVAVTEVLVDDAAVTDYRVQARRGALQRTADWPRGSMIKITYEAGYGDRQTVEAEHPAVVQWILERVARQYERGREGLAAEQISGVGGVTWSDEDWSLLAPYRLPVL